MARKVRKFAGRFVRPALSVTGHAGSTGHIITAGADAGRHWHCLDGSYSHARKSRGYSQYNPMPCNRLAYRTASCRSKLGTSTLMAEAKGSCGVSPDPSIISQPTASTLTPWGCSCLSVCLSSATRTGGLARCGMRDMPTEGAKGPAAISSHPQLTTANEPASQKSYGEVNRGRLQMEPRTPPPFRCGSGTTAVTSSSLLDPACARCGYLRAPLAVSRPCAFAPCLVREGREEKKKKKIVGAYQILLFFLTLLSQRRGVAPVTLPHL